MGAQRQIRAFLMQSFGKDKGKALFAWQSKIRKTLIQNQKDTSTTQKIALATTILPSIALYKALRENGFSQQRAHARVQSYMLDTVAAKMHTFAAKTEPVPGFYALYSRIFLAVMRRADLWQSEQVCGRDSFDVTIYKCLWHTACAENGCPELCRVFCEADNVTYGGLKKIGFTRTQTLGCGGSCCDFHFYKKR